MSIKGVLKCGDDCKERFSNAKVLMTISVGQEVHEGDKFRIAVDLVNAHFAQCTILVDDSLQRHSMALLTGKKAEDFYQSSIAAGDLWIERSRSIFSSLTIPYKLERWDKWLRHENFVLWYDKIKHAYEVDEHYREKLQSSAHEFLRRFLARGTVVYDYNTEFDLCIDYLLEECVALCLWASEGYDFEVYPNKRNTAMSATHARFIASHNPLLILPVWIKFKNRKQYLPQNLELVDADI